MALDEIAGRHGEAPCRLAVAQETDVSNGATHGWFDDVGPGRVGHFCLWHNNVNAADATAKDVTGDDGWQP